MTALTLAAPTSRFSVLTIADRHAGAPVWSDRLGWPLHGDNHVALDARDASRRNVWASRIDDAVLHADRAVLMVAEGVGCAAAAWWARLSPRHYADRVAGALLFDPVAPTGETGALFASPGVVLPFPSMVVTARNRVAAPGDMQDLIDGWGSRLMIADRHRAPGAWQAAQRLLSRMTAAVVARDIDRGMALRGE
ncbi:alpha/beta hydrolase [Sphingomonas sp. J315]|nr:alpha/beta hydrolase [Sphingomonas sp. J315]UUX99348.1 alpha/beta hydrolase [Sphingomonas sp. J315]